MSRSYKRVRPKANRVYTVPDVMQLFDICRNTVSNWVVSGLRPSDGSRPHVFRGAKLKRFHKERKARKRGDLRKGEFKCVGCGSAVFPNPNSIIFKLLENGAISGESSCPDCNANVFKFLKKPECDSIKKACNTNTSLASLHEEKGVGPAGIGKNPVDDADNWYFRNDRILQKWQLYAGRYDNKTVDAHLAAIRQFEVFFHGKLFDTIKVEDAAAYRAAMLERVQLPKSEGGLSKSTLQHRASHLAAFFKWLQQQEGYRRLNASLPGYFALPRKQLAKALPSPAKVYPTIKEAITLVKNMPDRTRIEQRDRAIVAFAFTTGFRAGALITLRMKHLDVVAKQAFQDGMQAHSKNGKSYWVKWFKGTEPLQDIVTTWVESQVDRGFSAEDALFPAGPQLGRKVTSQDPVNPMDTICAVTKAFFVACAGVKENYTPHSARHTLKVLGDQLCSAAEERQAWSGNLGHENEIVTQTYYGKMTTDRRFELLGQIGSSPNGTDANNELMLDYYQHRLIRGTPEFAKAKRLANERDERNEEREIE